MNNEVIDTATSYPLYKDQVAEYLKETFKIPSTIMDDVSSVIFLIVIESPLKSS